MLVTEGLAWERAWRIAVETSLLPTTKMLRILKFMFHRDLRGDISRIRYINATRSRLSSELSVLVANQSRGIWNRFASYVLVFCGKAVATPFK